jgi:thioredoxin reductase (NADPH)
MITTLESTKSSGDLFDLTIVGAGPVGLYGLYYAGLRLMKTKVIDLLDQVGGALTSLYPEKYIYDVAGFPKVLAKELVRQLLLQAKQYPQAICLREEVISIDTVSADEIRLVTSLGTHRSRTVVICAGPGRYVPRRLDIPNLRELEGRGVYYSVTDPEQFRNRRVLVVGGGDAAFDASLMLGSVARSVVHIHRNDFFNAHEDSVNKVRQSAVDLRVPFWELRLVEGVDWVSAATIVNSQTRESVRIDLDAIVLNLGFATDLGPIQNWGLHLEKGAIVVDNRMRTNREGVFAAGDIATYDGKLKLISTGCGEVAVAVNNAKNYIDPKAKVSPGHSTDKHVVAVRRMAQLRAKDHSGR